MNNPFSFMLFLVLPFVYLIRQIRGEVLGSVMFLLPTLIPILKIVAIAV